MLERNCLPAEFVLNIAVLLISPFFSKELIHLLTVDGEILQSEAIVLIFGKQLPVSLSALILRFDKTANSDGVNPLPKIEFGMV